MCHTIRHIRSWADRRAVTEAAIRRVLETEGFCFYRWASQPGRVYQISGLTCCKMVYILDGSLTLDLPGGQITLKPGDRFDLPAGITGQVISGPEGLVCLGAHRVCGLPENYNGLGNGTDFVQ